MANLLKLKGKQIEDSSILNNHIGEPILESNLALDVATQSIQDALDTLEGKKLLTYIGINGTITSGATGSKVVTTEILAASLSGTPGGDSTTAGIVTTGLNNKVQIRDTATGQPIEQTPGGSDVYGRLTESTGVYTLTYFYDNAGTETAYSFSADTGIDILFPESAPLDSIPFNAIVNGVSFVDGLPAVHNHTVSEITDITVTAAEINDLATLGRLDDTANGASGADIIGVTPDNFSNLSATDVQAALEELDGLVGSGVSSVMGSDNLTTQVDDADPALFTVTQGNFVANTLKVFVNGSKQVKGLQYNETTPGSGVFTFIAGAIPTGTDVVDTSYNYL